MYMNRVIYRSFILSQLGLSLCQQFVHTRQVAKQLSHFSRLRFQLSSDQDEIYLFAAINWFSTLTGLAVQVEYLSNLYS